MKYIAIIKETLKSEYDYEIEYVFDFSNPVLMLSIIIFRTNLVRSAAGTGENLRLD